MSVGRGEREAICLARELNADAVLLDDARAKRVALQSGLVAIGTLTVLFRAAECGWVRFPEAMRRLLDMNFRAPADLVRTLLDVDQARRSSLDKD